MFNEIHVEHSCGISEDLDAAAVEETDERRRQSMGCNDPKDTKCC